MTLGRGQGWRVTLEHVSGVLAQTHARAFFALFLAPAHLLGIHDTFHKRDAGWRVGVGTVHFHCTGGNAVLKQSTETLRCSVILSFLRFWQKRDSSAARMVLLIRYWWFPCTTGFPCQRPFDSFRIGTLEQCT